MTTAGPAPKLKSLKFTPLPPVEGFAQFLSGEGEIDRNLPKCCEWEKCHRARVVCAFFPDDPVAAGFYCLSLHAHEAKTVQGFFAGASADARNFVPFIYLNYLAVRPDVRRQKIGTLLLLHALERCAIVIRNVGAYGVALHALNDIAAGLYDRYGFRAPDENARPPFMLLPAQSVLDLFPIRKAAT